MRTYLTELTGSFFLAMALGLSGYPLTAGLLLTVLIYLGRDSSGAHYNPAVTLAFWGSGKLTGKQAALYVIVQAAGFLIAGLWLYSLSGNTLHLSPGYATPGILYAGLDILFGGLFATVYLIFYFYRRLAGNILYGLVIGLCYSALIMIAEPVTGSYLNSAGFAAFAVLEGVIYRESLLYLSIYILSPMIGGLAAGHLFKQINSGETVSQEGV